MLRSSIRTLLRRRLNDVPGETWTDSELNEYINIAYALVMKRVRAADPEAVLDWEYRDTVADTNWYQKPTGTRGPVEVGLKSTASDSEYTALARKPYWVARDWVGPNTVYCHRGEYIGLFPAPSAAVTNGLRFIHVPTPSLAADTDSPRLEDTLQFGVVLWAAILAKGESPEADTKDAVQLQAILSEIPSDYGSIDQSQPMNFSPDVADTRGRGVIGLNPGIDPGRTQ